jgi:hypothetical protein
MSWIVEAPKNNPSVFVLISSTVFEIDGSACPSGGWEIISSNASTAE